MDPGKKKKKTKRPLSVRLADKTKRIFLGGTSKITGPLSMRGLERQEERIKGDWDNLIMLDACRYDYFEREYPTFLEGKLSKLRSPASWTYAWLSRMFGGKYKDIRFYSSHPGVNSRGVGRAMGYIGADHFSDIVDVWDSGWDSELGTVHPKTLTDAVLNDIKSGKIGKRNIIWYVQPHSPWIGKTKLAGFRKDWNDKAVLVDIKKKISSGEITQEEFEHAYRDNLRLALEYVAELVPHLKGKTVVSADHGELLGEWGYYTHPSFYIHKNLRTVPWLEVTGSKAKKKAEKAAKAKEEKAGMSDEEKIKERLMNLGYM